MLYGIPLLGGGIIMMEKTLYPKTRRMKAFGDVELQITEKMNGENITIFTDSRKNKYLATRNFIFTDDDLKNNIDVEANKPISKRLKAWFLIYACKEIDLLPNRAIHCEWLGDNKEYMEQGGKPVLIFAKSIMKISKVEIDEEFLKYNHDNLKYAFVNAVIPDCLDKVPHLCSAKMKHLMNLTDYDLRCDIVGYSRLRGYHVEGFVYSNDDEQILLKALPNKQKKWRRLFK